MSTINYNKVDCYTDGSNLKGEVSAWAFIVLDPQTSQVIHQDSGILTGEICSIWNIGAELTAVINAVSWAKNNNYKLTINHDLEGIAKWARFEWKAKNKWTQEYQNFILENKDYIAGFVWVKGHSDNPHNNMVDKLAGKTLKEYNNQNTKKLIGNIWN